MNTVSWHSSSNIALVKYWGKKDIQIPMNPSISFTLDASYTETKVNFDRVNKNDEISLSFFFEGKVNAEFEVRLIKYIKTLLEYIPVLKGMHLHIESSNSFPHSSGIASSASGMSALALCLVSIEKQINGTLHYIDDFYQKASFIARLGSGSAARSVYGGINLWGNYADFSNSSNDFSIEITPFCHPIFTTYGDAILIVTDKTKKVSSSVGHTLMHKHPFAEMKFKRAFENTGKLLSVLKSGDPLEFANIVEEEALWLHAMMMTSNPTYLLMEPNTLTLISKIRELRRTSHIPLCFTLDAGANVHLLYPNNETETVKAFIKHELEPYCVQKRWIDDKVGNGSVEIEY